MKLIVIVLCLLSERYLIHHYSMLRFDWFNVYCDYISSKMRTKQPSILLIATLAPILLLVGFLLYFFAPIGYGFIGFLINLAIFYYCIGPQNPFYPVFSNEEQSTLTDYLVDVNHQIIGVMVWYLLLGLEGAILYRLLSLSQVKSSFNPLAHFMFSLLDWVSVRVTGMLYMLVGNFQRTYLQYSKFFLSHPNKNQEMMQIISLDAFELGKDELMVTALSRAERFVALALLVFLVFLALIYIV